MAVLSADYEIKCRALENNPTTGLERDLDPRATFHTSHTRAGGTAYKKALTGTTIEVANGTILPVDGFGTFEVGPDQPNTTTKLVKMVAVAYVPGGSRNLLSTCKAVKQWSTPLIYYKTKVVSGFPGEESSVFNSCHRKYFFPATRRTPRQGTALALAARTAETIRVESPGK